MDKRKGITAQSIVRNSLGGKNENQNRSMLDPSTGGLAVCPHPGGRNKSELQGNAPILKRGRYILSQWCRSYRAQDWRHADPVLWQVNTCDTCKCRVSREFTCNSA